MHEADFVIVGAGSAGCVLATRLSENPSTSVLLVEAGRRERIPITRIPGALLKTIGNPRYDWCFTSEPDPSRNGQSELWPRGKVPGGSSAINGMIFIRGAPADYDAWAALGNPGWASADVLPLFRKLETADAPDNAFRGGLGPLRVSALRWRHPASDLFIRSAIAAGIPPSEDLNGRQHEGVAWNQGSTINGARHSAWDAYVAPNLKRANLRTLDGVLVERVVLDGTRATGIAAVRDGARLDIRARRGVVLCAGAINSPHLLMLSGIGDPAELAAHGIETRIASPEVGRSLMEHPGLYVQLLLDMPTANREATPLRATLAALRWLLTRSGPLSVPTAQVLAFFRSAPDQQEPDIQFHLFAYGSMLKDGRRIIPREDLATILMNLNHPKSRRHLALRSADPREAIAIHPRLMEHADDVEGLLRGLGWVRKVAGTKPFGAHVRELRGVPPAEAGREADLDYLRGAVRPFYHPAGTCRMGSDDAAVVDPALRVRGAQALWVADVSIFPRHIAGNANATALMIGEKAAELIGTH